jgi:hypothetical protein
MSLLLPFPLPKKKALEIIRGLSEVSERIFYSPHAKARMIERGVSMPDVMDCLGKGQITEGPFQQPGGVIGGLLFPGLELGHLSRSSAQSMLMTTGHFSS